MAYIMITQTKHNELLDKFIFLISEKKFYDAHESIEYIWFPRRFEQDNEIKLLKGFINAAVSFELIKRGRYKASERVWNTYLKYIVLIDKIDSPHIQKYHLIATHVENFKKTIDDLYDYNDI